LNFLSLSVLKLQFGTGYTHETTNMQKMLTITWLRRACVCIRRRTTCT